MEDTIQRGRMKDVIEDLARSHRTGTLAMARDLQEGAISFANGRIQQARVGRFRGPDAILDLLSWTSGAYSFDNSSRVTEEDPTNEEFELSSVLSTSAWLASEIQRRKTCLPKWNQQLIAKPLCPTALKVFDNLPVEKVHQAISANTEIFLGELLTLELGPTPHVLLSLAVLVDQQSVELVSDTDLATRSVIPAILELADHLDRRLSDHRDPTLSILYQPAGWHGLFEIIKTIPEDILRVQRRRLLKHLQNRRRGAIRLSVEDHHLLLSLQPISHGSLFRTDPTVVTAVGVVVWLSGTGWEALHRECLVRVSKGGGATGLIVLPDGAESRQRTNGWRDTASRPESFTELCKLLVQK